MGDLLGIDENWSDDGDADDVDDGIADDPSASETFCASDRYGLRMWLADKAHYQKAFDAFQQMLKRSGTSSQDEEKRENVPQMLQVGGAQLSRDRAHSAVVVLSFVAPSMWWASREAQEHHPLAKLFSLQSRLRP